MTKTLPVPTPPAGTSANILVVTMILTFLTASLTTILTFLDNRQSRAWQNRTEVVQEKIHKAVNSNFLVTSIARAKAERIVANMTSDPDEKVKANARAEESEREVERLQRQADENP